VPPACGRRPARWPSARPSTRLHGRRWISGRPTGSSRRTCTRIAWTRRASGWCSATATPPTTRRRQAGRGRGPRRFERHRHATVAYDVAWSVPDVAGRVHRRDRPCHGRRALTRRAAGHRCPTPCCARGSRRRAMYSPTSDSTWWGTDDRGPTPLDLRIVARPRPRTVPRCRRPVVRDGTATARRRFRLSAVQKESGGSAGSSAARPHLRDRRRRLAVVLGRQLERRPGHRRAGRLHLGPGRRRRVRRRPGERVRRRAVLAQRHRRTRDGAVASACPGRPQVLGDGSGRRERSHVRRRRSPPSCTAGLNDTAVGPERAGA
jgi:hypothetical protein